MTPLHNNTSAMAKPSTDTNQGMRTLRMRLYKWGRWVADAFLLAPYQKGQRKRKETREEKEEKKRKKEEKSNSNPVAILIL